MFRCVRSRPLLLLCLAAAGALTARPVRAEPSTPDFRAIAERLTDAISGAGSIRVAVVPLANGELPLATDVAADATARLDAALAAQAATPGRRLTFVAGSEIDRAVNDLGVVPPLGPRGALNVGVLVDADYVVVGTAEVARGGAVNALSVDLLEVKGGKRVGGAEFPEGDSHARGLLAGAGFSAAALAAWMAVSANRDVVHARDELLALPVGATAEWNAEYAHARDLERTRLMWWTVAAGAAGATAYVVFLRPTGRHMDARRVLGLPMPRRVAIAPSRRGPGLVVAASF